MSKKSEKKVDQTEGTPERKPRRQAAAEGKSPPIKVVRSFDELKEAVGEEQAKRIMAGVEKVARGIDGDTSKTHCRVTIEFEAPNAVLAQAAVSFLKHVVSETIEASRWGHGSFQSEIVEPTELPKSEDEKDEPRPEAKPKPVSPLN
jgi:hypothetical protein